MKDKKEEPNCNLVNILETKENKDNEIKNLKNNNELNENITETTKETSNELIQNYNNKENVDNNFGKATDDNKEEVENLQEDVNNKQNNSTSNKLSKKSLKFWVLLISGIIVVAQFICYYFLGQEIEIKLVVEFVSFVLAILVFAGIIKSDSVSTCNIDDIGEIKDKISSSICENIENYKQKDKNNKE